MCVMHKLSILHFPYPQISENIVNLTRITICHTSLYLIQRPLTLVQSARHLKKSQLSRNGSNPDTFITVNVKQPHSHHVLQGSTGCTPYSSRVHRDCSCPEYNEKLTLLVSSYLPAKFKLEECVYII